MPIIQRDVANGVINDTVIFNQRRGMCKVTYLIAIIFDNPIVPVLSKTHIEDQLTIEQLYIFIYISLQGLSRCQSIRACDIIYRICGRARYPKDVNGRARGSIACVAISAQ